MSWILILVLLFFCFNGLIKKGVIVLHGIPANWIPIAFSFKLLATISLVWLYTHHYTNRAEADIYKYYDDGMVVNRVLHQDAGVYIRLMTGLELNEKEKAIYLKDIRHWNRPGSWSFLHSNRLLIRFNAILALISSGNIWFHSLVASILGFLGLVCFYKSFHVFVPGKEKVLFFLLFFSPSLTFWTSGILKEAFLIFGIGVLAYGLRKLLLNGPAVRNMVFTAIGLLFLISSRSYVLLLFFPGMMSWWWNRDRNDGKGIWRYLVVNGLLLAIFLNVPIWLTDMNPLNALARYQQEFKCLAEWVGAGSQIYVPDLNSGLLSFLYASPVALFNSLFRPGIFDQWTFLNVPFIVETTGILLFAILGLNRLRKVRLKHQNFILFNFNFILLLALLIGLTTPVLGAIVRYRVPVMPFLFLTILIIFALPSTKST